MERRVMGNYHARCGTGEKTEITSKSYLSSFSDDNELLTQEFLAHYTQSIAAARTVSFILGQLENDVLRRKLRHSVCKRSLWFALVLRNDNRFFIGFGSLRVLLGFRFIEHAELVGRNVKTIEKSSV